MRKTSIQKDFLLGKCLYAIYCANLDIVMANGQKRSRKRRPRKGPRSRRGSSQNPFMMQSIGAVVLIVLVIFLVPLGVIGEGTAIVICMIVMAAMVYLTTMSDKPRKRKRRSSKKSETNESEPQFYTALPSTLGLTEIPEQTPTPQIKLPPRPIRAARRRRDFVTYPLSVGGGDYSDSYVQVDKDTVLRLRSEMAPAPQSLKLPGQRIDLFPLSKTASLMSQEVESEFVEAAPVVAEAAPVVAEAAPVVAEAAPLVAEAAPVVAEAAPVVAEEEEEDEMEFDMEWD